MSKRFGTFEAELVDQTEELNPEIGATYRVERWQEIEDMLRSLSELGWRLERSSLIDEENEPLRAVLRIACDRPSSLDGII